MNKNKSIEELLLYVNKFFKVFIFEKSNMQQQGNDATSLYLVGHAISTINNIKQLSIYEPAKFEMLKDLSARQRTIRALIYLLFLIKKVEVKNFYIPKVFQV